MHKNFIKICLIFNLLLFSTVMFAKDYLSHFSQVTFVQITDVHLHNKSVNHGSRMLKDSEELLRDAIKQVNNIDFVDFAVFTGDMVDIPNKSLINKFKQIANQLTIPWYWTTGNHDVNSSLNNYDFAYLMSDGKINKSYYSFKKDNFLFVFMDGSITNRITANANFSKDELDWLDKELSDNKYCYVVIFQHFPVIEPFPSKSHSVLNTKEYLNVIDKHKNVTAVISGHYHTAKVKLRNKVAHISSPSLVQYPNAFRKIHISNQSETITIQLDWYETQLSDIQEASYQNCRSAKLHNGNEKYRNAIIRLYKPLYN